MKSYLDLDAWKKSRSLVKEIYSLIQQFPDSEKFGLISQMRRSAVSVPSNIAEESGRNTSKDSLQFFFVSRGSLYELETQLYISFDLNFLQEEKLNELIAQIVVCKKLINGLIKYYETL